MHLKSIAPILAAFASLAVAEPTTEPAVPKQIAKIISRADGATKQTAYKVKSVRQEYEVLRALGLVPGTQYLIVTDKPYDRFDATDPRTGATREVWFDISSFYPEF